MHKIKPQGRRQSTSVSTLLTVLTVMLVLCLSEQSQAQTQWTTAPNGTDIYKTSSGNVGIGTTTPVSQLEIVGAAPFITLTHANGSHDNSEVVYRNNSGFYKWGIINYSDGHAQPSVRNALSFLQFTDKNNAAVGAHRLLINDSGNIGIGLHDNLFGKLNVSNSGGNSALDLSGTTFVGINAQNAATSNNQISYGIVGATNAGETFSGKHYGVYGYATGAPNNYNDGATIVGVRGDASSPFGASATPATTAGGYFSVTVNTPALGTVPITPRGYGVYAKATSTSNTGTSTLYGVYIDTANSSAIPITYGLYQAGTAANNYFAGNVGIGTTAPGYKLDVQGGQINASGGLCIAGDCKTSWSLVGLGGSSPWTTSGSSVSYSSGNVGIGTTNPTAKLDINGDINVAGKINAKYQDIAEWVPTAHALPPGTVVVLDPTQSNRVMASATAYDTRVAGVISERPGLALGETGKDKVLVATMGRVKVKVDATRSPIQVGDLLVTSGVEGVAMKSEPVDLGGVKLHRPGTMIGKALEPLEKGTGEILVLLSLQ